MPDETTLLSFSPYSRLGNGNDIPKEETLLDAGYYRIASREVERSADPITLTSHSSTIDDIADIAATRDARIAAEKEVRADDTAANQDALDKAKDKEQR